MIIISAEFNCTGNRALLNTYDPTSATLAERPTFAAHFSSAFRYATHRKIRGRNRNRVEAAAADLSLAPIHMGVRCVAIGQMKFKLFVQMNLPLPTHEVRAIITMQSSSSLVCTIWMIVGVVAVAKRRYLAFSIGTALVRSPLFQMRACILFNLRWRVCKRLLSGKHGRHDWRRSLIFNLAHHSVGASIGAICTLWLPHENYYFH